MLHARRLYVYLVSAVALTALGIGLVNLVELALTQVWSVIEGTTVIDVDGESVRRQISLYTALVIVSLPIWLLHWFFAERAARPHTPESDRFSAIRALFLALVLLVTLQILVQSGIELAQQGFRRLLDAPDPFFGSDSTTMPIAILLVIGAIWAYHASVRLRDMANGALDGAAAWLPRFYLYVAAFTGAIMILFAITQLLRIANEALFQTGDVVTGDRWWASSLAESLGVLVVGLVVWGAHWAISLRLLNASDWRGASERSAALRSAYLYLIILVGVSAALFGAFGSLTVLFEPVFGVDVDTADPFLLRLLQPLLIALPFAGAWALHRWIAIREAERFAGAPRQASVRRFYTYLVALVGLALTAVGAAYLLGLVLDLLFGATDFLDTGRDWAPRQASEFLAVLIVGTLAWLWHWYAVQRRLIADPAGERAATIRRVYLYVVLAVALLATLISLGTVLYELLQLALGVGSRATLAADISRTLAIVVVAGSVLAYHLTILRRDLAESPPAVEPADETVPAVGPAVEPAAPVVALPLTLRGPEGADLDAVIATLREHVPPGFELARDDVVVVPEPEPVTEPDILLDIPPDTPDVDEPPPSPSTAPADSEPAAETPSEPIDQETPPDTPPVEGDEDDHDDHDDEPEQRKSRIYH